MPTCQVGLVVIDLITSPVVSWRGCETPPQYRGSAVILCSTTVVRGPLSSWWPAVVVCLDLFTLVDGLGLFSWTYPLSIFFLFS